mmetsp:Transcript_4052/g.7371  ORF Transcript_4052/g.7371 Transcript_4052/m.7371 type:complete len:249 (+) Transcript_4052:68-814(+)
MAFKVLLFFFLASGAFASPADDPKEQLFTNKTKDAGNSSLLRGTLLLGQDNTHAWQLANFSDYLTNAVDNFRGKLKNMLGNFSADQPATKTRNCLCIFDIDRTLTGKQGDIGSCPGNKVVGGYDDAYGGGALTLSQLGQNLWSTFCGACHVRAITAHPHHRANLPVSASVVGCNAGCKAYHAGRLASGLGISRSEVYMFDDKAENIRPFYGTGMNAHQVSCSSREGNRGLCGARLAEISNSKGVTTCR